VLTTPFYLATQTGTDGSFELGGLPDGRHRLWAQSAQDPALVASEILALAPDAPVEWEPVLVASPGIRLQLVDTRRTPLAGWNVQLRRPSGDGTLWIRRLPLDAGERVRIFDCLEGGAALEVYDPSSLGASYATLKKIFPSEEEQRITIDTDLHSQVSGALLDEGGQPCRRGKLSVFSLRSTVPIALERDPETGEFEQRLAEGDYWLVLQDEPAVCWLAKIELEPCGRVDLGPLRLPEPGRLRLQLEGAPRGSRATA
jgi:hypothetical protein